MNPQQKRLVMIAGGAGVGFLVLYFLASTFFLGPAKKLDAAAAGYTEDINESKAKTGDLSEMASRIHKVSKTTLGKLGDEQEVQSNIEVHLRELLKQSGLDWESKSFSNKPVTGNGKKKIFAEVARRVVTSGRLCEVVNFFYLLDRQPIRHRVDSIEITPKTDSDNSHEVELKFRYSTIILGDTKGVTLGKTNFADIEPITLNAPDYEQYAVLSTRDPLRR